MDDNLLTVCLLFLKGKTMRHQGLTDSEAANCSHHSECSYFDCQGECDMISGKCRDNVVNNNLQVDVFLIISHKI